MKTSWIKGLDENVSGELKGAFKVALPVRKRLQYILNEKIEQHFKAQQNRTNYENSSWAYEQADSMGYCRALGEVISLLEDKETNTFNVKPVGRPSKETTKPESLV